MSALGGVNGDLWLSTSPSTSLGSPETCNDSGDHIHYFTSTHQAWDPTQPFTIQYSPNGSSGWTNDTSGDYTFYWPVGEIVFSSARTPGTNNFIRISQGNYFTLSALDGAHMWKNDLKLQTKDTTAFQATGNFTTILPTLKQLTFTVDAYRQDARILIEMGNTNISGGRVLCQLWWNEVGGQRWVFYGLPTDLSESVAANDIEKQAVSFSNDGPVYLITSTSLSQSTVIAL